MINYSIDFIKMFTLDNLFNCIITFYLCSLFIHKSLLCFYRSSSGKADLGNTRYPYRLFNSELPLLFIRTCNIIRQLTGKPDDWTERERERERERATHGVFRSSLVNVSVHQTTGQRKQLNV